MMQEWICWLLRRHSWNIWGGEKIPAGIGRMIGQGLTVCWCHRCGKVKGFAKGKEPHGSI